MSKANVQSLAAVDGNWSARGGWRAVYLTRDRDGRVEVVGWPICGWAGQGEAVWPVCAPAVAGAGLVLAGSPGDPRLDSYVGVVAPGADPESLADLDPLISEIVRGWGVAKEYREPDWDADGESDWDEPLAIERGAT